MPRYPTELEYANFSQVKAKRSWEDVSGRQTFDVETLFLDAHYDINTGTAVTPYIGAGIGAGFINTRGRIDVDGLGGLSTGARTVTNFAWNVGAGVSYDFNAYVSVDLGYRFAGLGSVKTKTVALDTGGDELRLGAKAENLYQHQVAVGLRFTF